MSCPMLYGLVQQNELEVYDITAPHLQSLCVCVCVCGGWGADKSLA
jgi:hypothetical protein